MAQPDVWVYDRIHDCPGNIPTRERDQDRFDIIYQLGLIGRRGIMWVGDAEVDRRLGKAFRNAFEEGSGRQWLQRELQLMQQAYWNNKNLTKSPGKRAKEI
ncbi:hypothetical protein CKAH01_08971 [Colletotrichum kahawae]|uniref:Uncharacterized protein n=1 Tax=Colletotrichum kahawae TaxID=34407 RepID=A0AAD9Y2M4_COLKA|nr:hypothetical protein CKAH01_08971 [Colletotrichum kahawae]